MITAEHFANVYQDEFGNQTLGGFFPPCWIGMISSAKGDRTVYRIRCKMKPRNG